MADFDAISNSLNNDDRYHNEVSNATVDIQIITLGGSNQLSVPAGMTVADFKRQNDLVGKKIVDAEGEVLADSYRLNSNMQIFVSTPKKNG